MKIYNIYSHPDELDAALVGAICKDLEDNYWRLDKAGDSWQRAWTLLGNKIPPMKSKAGNTLYLELV